MELPDIVSLGKPSRFDLPSRQPWPLTETFMRYELLERIPSGADDECYWARLRGPAGFERLVFLRRTAVDRFDDATIDAIKQQGLIAMRGIAQLFELGRYMGWGFVVTEIVVGASVAALARGRRGEVSWLVALAIAFDACARLWRVHERYGQLIDLAVTPGRIILSATGEVTLCPGLPSSAFPRPWHRMVCDILHPILALAAVADEERAMLRELFTDENPDAVWVASDALVQQHPELDPVLPIVFLALAGRVPRAAAHAALVERVPIEQLRALWHLVVDAAARRC